jgi:hypothetical protein
MVKPAFVRIARLHRELAEAYEQLGSGVPLAGESEPKPRARKQSRRPYVPQTEVSELEVARARQAAKRAGIPVR